LAEESAEKAAVAEKSAREEGDKKKKEADSAAKVEADKKAAEDKKKAEEEKKAKDKAEAEKKKVEEAKKKADEERKKKESQALVQKQKEAVEKAKKEEKHTKLVEKMNQALDQFSVTLNKKHYDAALQSRDEMKQAGFDVAEIKVHTMDIYKKSFTFPQIAHNDYAVEQFDTLASAEQNLNADPQNESQMEAFLRTADEVAGNLKDRYKE